MKLAETGSNDHVRIDAERVPVRLGRNAGRIAGLVGRDREMVALMARCHRKEPARIRALIAASSLRKKERAALRNAIVLDVVVRDGTAARDDADLMRKARFLGEELGLAVRITVARVTGAVAAP